MTTTTTPMTMTTTTTPMTTATTTPMTMTTMTTTANDNGDSSSDSAMMRAERSSFRGAGRTISLF